MKVAIYSPYLDTLGGGERYMMTIAEILSSKNLVHVLLDTNLFLQDIERLKQNLQDRFGLNLSSVKFVEAPLGKDTNFLKRAIFFMNYDLLFYLTDGSLFYPTSTKNILHIQSPIIGQPAKSLFGKLKLNGWDLVIYNSKFTKENCQKYWRAKSKVIYPPVDVKKIEPLKKKKYILSVGRFFGYLKDKKHEGLIKAFKDLQNKEEASGWSLHLVGSAGEGDLNYIDHLKELSKNLDINFYPNLDYDSLIKLYGESAIYWHAAGFGEEDPTKLEHFGISTVEAMAGGCVPVVIGKGGQLEIVDEGKNGFLWKTEDELIDKSLKLIRDEKLREKISEKSIKKSSMFGKEVFESSIKSLVDSL